MFGKKQKDQTRRPYSVERADTYYYKQGNKTKNTPKPDRPRNQAAWWHNLPVYVATLVIVGSLLLSLFLTTTPKIVIVNDQDTSVQPFLRSKDSYSSIVEKQLSRSLLNRSKITFNTEKLAVEIGEQLPETTEVSITLPIIGRNPVVYLRIAEPAFVLVSATSSQVIDELGRAVVPTSELPDPGFAKQLLVVDDESGVVIESGKQALTKEQVAFIQSVNAMLDTKNVEVKRMVLPQAANELHVYPSGESYYVKYNFLLDPSEQTGKYLAVKHRLAKEKSSPKQYIDVRVEDRAYVR